MYVCYKKYENKQKEWHPATKPYKSDTFVRSQSVNVRSVAEYTLQL
jgi:hypothetical protein